MRLNADLNINHVSDYRYESSAFGKRPTPRITPLYAEWNTTTGRYTRQNDECKPTHSHISQSFIFPANNTHIREICTKTIIRINRRVYVEMGRAFQQTTTTITRTHSKKSADPNAKIFTDESNVNLYFEFTHIASNSQSFVRFKYYNF